MPITEKEAAAALRALPTSSWLRRYCRHGFKQTTAPLVYHVGIGLTLLGVTAPIHYGMRYAGTLRANNYTLLIGRSGEDNKTSALNVGIKILRSAAPELVGDFPGSSEGLFEQLEAVPSQVIPMEEFGMFLSKAQNGYYEPVKTLLAQVWDCGGLSRIRANKKQVRIPNPRLSIAAACSIPYLEKHTLAEDWSGGFMGRWFVLYGRRCRDDADPVGDDTDFDRLADELRMRAMIPEAGWYRGLDNQAYQLWTDWYNEVMSRQLPSNIIGIRARAPTIARKICLALAWDYGHADQDGWEIGLDVMIPAIEIAELHIRSVVELSAVIAEHDDARLRRSVMASIGEMGGAATLGEILNRLKLRKRPVLEMLDTLIESNVVYKGRTALEGDNTTYILKADSDY